MLLLSCKCTLQKKFLGILRMHIFGWFASIVHFMQKPVPQTAQEMLKVHFVLTWPNAPRTTWTNSRYSLVAFRLVTRLWNVSTTKMNAIWMIWWQRQKLSLLHNFSKWPGTLVLVKFDACILEVRKVLIEKSEIAFGKPQVFYRSVTNGYCVPWTWEVSHKCLWWCLNADVTCLSSIVVCLFPQGFLHFG